MPILGVVSSSLPTKPLAYESIASVNGDNSSSTITFSSIPSGYVGLQLRAFCRGTRSFDYESLYVRINGDSGNNYSTHYYYSDAGAGPQSGNGTSTNVIVAGWMPGATSPIGDNLTSAIIDIHYPTTVSANKTVRVFGGFDSNNSNPGAGFLTVSSGMWMNTSAITSVSFLSNGPFTSTSRFALYGIKGA